MPTSTQRDAPVFFENLWRICWCPWGDVGIAPYAIFSAFPKIDGFIVAPFFFVCKVCSRLAEGDDGDFGAVSDAHRNAAAAAKAAADHEAGSPKPIEPCRVVREELIVRAENRADEGQPHHTAVRVPAQNEIGT